MANGTQAKKYCVPHRGVGAKTRHEEQHGGQEYKQQGMNGGAE